MEILRQPVAGPAAWRGGEPTEPRVWTHTLSAEEMEELRRACESARCRGLPVARITASDFPLTHLKRTIESWVETLRAGRGFVLVKGLPIRDLNETEAGLLFWGIGQHMGIPKPQNPQGDLLGHVRDTGKVATHRNVRGYQTRQRLTFHVDGSDVVGLLCLKPAKRGGLSRIVSSVAIYNEILHRRPDLIDTLYQPFCIDRRDEQGEGELPYWEIPICRVRGRRLLTFYHSMYVESAQRHPQVPRFTPQQRQVLDLYKEIANSKDFYLDMDFDAGDMQFLSNHVVLHARTAYEDYTEPERRRHLLRLWLKLKAGA